jgi:hypothetical protein
MSEEKQPLKQMTQNASFIISELRHKDSYHRLLNDQDILQKLLNSTQNQAALIANYKARKQHSFEYDAVQMREKGHFLHISNNSYNKVDSWTKELEHSRPLLNSRKQVNDFLLLGSSTKNQERGKVGDSSRRIFNNCARLYTN